MANYKFASIIEVDKEYKLEGLNIWNHYWHCSARSVQVLAPYEGQPYFFKEYTIENNGKIVQFVVGEFSNGKIGLYIQDELSNKEW